MNHARLTRRVSVTVSALMVGGIMATSLAPASAAEYDLGESNIVYDGVFDGGNTGADIAGDDFILDGGSASTAARLSDFQPNDGELTDPDSAAIEYQVGSANRDWSRARIPMIWHLPNKFPYREIEVRLYSPDGGSIEFWFYPRNSDGEVRFTVTPFTEPTSGPYVWRFYDENGNQIGEWPDYVLNGPTAISVSDPDAPVNVPRTITVTNVGYDTVWMTIRGPQRYDLEVPVKNGTATFQFTPTVAGEFYVEAWSSATTTEDHLAAAEFTVSAAGSVGGEEGNGGDNGIGTDGATGGPSTGGSGGPSWAGGGQGRPSGQRPGHGRPNDSRPSDNRPGHNRPVKPSAPAHTSRPAAKHPVTGVDASWLALAGAALTAAGGGLALTRKRRA